MINSTDQSSATSSENPSSTSADTQKLRQSSRSQFSEYRAKVRNDGLPKGSIHSTAPQSGRRERVRSANQLLRRFFGLLKGYRGQIV